MLRRIAIILTLIAITLTTITACLPNDDAVGHVEDAETSSYTTSIHDYTGYAGSLTYIYDETHDVAIYIFVGAGASGIAVIDADVIANRYKPMKLR